MDRVRPLVRHLVRDLVQAEPLERLELELVHAVGALDVHEELASVRGGGVVELVTQLRAQLNHVACRDGLLQ